MSNDAVQKSLNVDNERSQQDQRLEENSIAVNTEPLQSSEINLSSFPERLKGSREESRILGRVKWFNPNVGYGFITRLDNQDDIFVHYTGITKKNPRHVIKSLADGELVEFNIMASEVTGPNGGPVCGNPYVSHISNRRQESLSSGDGLRFPSSTITRRYPRLPIATFAAYEPSRIPRWNGIYRNLQISKW